MHHAAAFDDWLATVKEYVRGCAPRASDQCATRDGTWPAGVKIDIIHIMCRMFSIVHTEMKAWQLEPPQTLELYGMLTES